jgi:hypothetical protein
MRRALYLWSKYVASVGWLLNVACLVSALVIVLHDFVFIGWPELFPHGAQLWKLAYQLSLALIASYVFFYMNVHLRRLREQETLRPFLYRHTLYILGDALSINNNLRNASGQGTPSLWPYEDFPPSREDLERMCKAVDPHHAVPQFVGDWFRYLSHQRKRTMDNISRIYTAVPFLEADYLHLLMEFENCHHLKTIDEIAAVRPNSTNMSFLVHGLHDYFEKASRLRDHAYSHLTASGRAEPMG